jgi:hypothetical protein
MLPFAYYAIAQLRMKIFLSIINDYDSSKGKLKRYSLVIVDHHIDHLFTNREIGQIKFSLEKNL